MEVITYDFKIRGDERGSLIAIEENADIPFSIRRVYYIYDTGFGVHRGLHAHKTLRQVMICIHGACTVCLDNGTDKIVVRMDNEARGLLVDSMVWHEMYDFSPDCVLLLLASDFYDEQDYIRDYGESLNLLGIV